MVTRKIDPLNYRVPIVDADGRPTPQFIRLWQQLFLNDNEINTLDQAIAALFAREINTVDGIQGGGDLSEDRTLSLTDTGVTPGTYGNASNVAQITVDAKGRLSAVADVPIASSGGGGYFNGQTPLGAVGVEGGSQATKGIVFQPNQDITVDSVLVALDPNAAGEEYIVRIVALSAFSATATINAITAVSPTYTTVSGATAIPRFTFASPVALTAGTPSAILFSWNNAALGTSVNRVLFATNGAPLNAPVETLQPNPSVATVAKQVPIVGDVLASPSVNRHTMTWLEGSA